MRSWFSRALTPHAEPGSWYGSYHSAWNAAHPGAWKRGELESGHFRLGRGDREGEDVWCSSTLNWDEKWFEAQGYRLPKYHRHIEPDRNPNILRIGTLGPGESVSIPVNLGNSSG